MTPEQFNENAERLRGLTLLGVRYYEVPSGQFIWNEYGDFDTVGQGIDLIFDSGSFHITWDNTFWNYGLIVRYGSMIDFLNTALFFSVSEESRWRDLIGQKISDVNIIWEQLPQGHDQPENVGGYPQSIIISFDNGKRFFLSAATFQTDSSLFFGMSDNIVVIFDETIAEKTNLFQMT